MRGKTSTLAVKLVLLCAIAAIALILYRADHSTFLHDTVMRMTKTELLASATFDKSLTLGELEKIRSGDWTLSKMFASEAKGRVRYRLELKEVAGVCLTGIKYPGGISLLFHKECEPKWPSDKQ